MTTATLGNGLQENYGYSGDRLQLTSISAISGSTSLLSLTYGYCAPGVSSCVSNNGNIQNQTITRSNWSWTDTYTYDALNRLTSGQETGTGTWVEGYQYDAFGNRTVCDPSQGCSNPGRSGLPGLTAETPNGPGQYNTRNQVNGWGYDPSGNILQIGTMARVFSYDAENRQLVAAVAGNSNSYGYDGEGRRVTKMAWGATTTYVYDAFGQLAVEYGPAADTGTKYLTGDALGSTRLATGVGTGGPVVSWNCDYLPFGEELGAGIAGRDSTFCAGAYPSAASAPDLKFTGKERDAETGLDWFESRYYQSAQGRFTSPDEFKGGFLDAYTGNAAFQAGPLPYADIGDPQTLNKYAYVRNNPLRFTDPDGHCIEDLCIGEAVALTAGTAAAVHYLQSPQGQESVRAFVFGAGILVNKAADAISSLFTKSDSKPRTLGKPDHQQTVKEEGERVNGQTEVPIPTPGGVKEGRRADAAGTNPQTGAPEIVQVYRPTPAGNIPKREKTAAADIEKATGVKPTMVPVRPINPEQPPKPNQENH